MKKTLEFSKLKLTNHITERPHVRVSLILTYMGVGRGSFSPDW